ncbi:Decaprenyl diphosphate synthase-like [Sesbania bispinosa]|nr:Decaprenyl diphosphate synthase-like [Sesbania bispinosa]
MQNSTGGVTRNLLGGFYFHLRRCLYAILSMGPMPNHIAFIMDGNRRYENKQNLKDGDGHRAGFSALLPMLRYCFEFGVKYVTVYAFSIDNFKRKTEEVETFMEFMREKIEDLLQHKSIINEYDSCEYYLNATKACNNLLEGLKGAGKKDVLFEHNVDKQGDTYSKAEITSCNGLAEITEERKLEITSIKVVDVEKHMYMAVAPDPEILPSGKAIVNCIRIGSTVYQIL